MTHWSHWNDPQYQNDEDEPEDNTDYDAMGEAIEHTKERAAERWIDENI